MTEPESITMDDEERDEFLGTGGTGVISFSRPEAGPPHAIPVSYGYDRSDSAFYFRLSIGPDSDKSDLVDRAVTFVVYGRRDDDWHSVVATGRLEATTDASVATETLEGLEQVHIPLVDIFGRPPKDVTFGFYRLRPADLTGRRESPTGA